MTFRAVWETAFLKQAGVGDNHWALSGSCTLCSNSMKRNGVTLAGVSLVSKRKSQERSKPGDEKQGWVLAVLAGTLVLNRDCALAITLLPELIQQGKGTLPFVFLQASISADVWDGSLEDANLFLFNSLDCCVPAQALGEFQALEATPLLLREGCETTLVLPPAFPRRGSSDLGHRYVRLNKCYIVFFKDTWYNN